jgi:hypothetical protein
VWSIPGHGATLEPHLGLKNLETLFIRFPPGCDSLDLTHTPPLKHLSIVTYEFEQHIPQLLSAVAPTLRQLDFSFVFCSTSSLGALTGALVQLTQLRHLAIHARFGPPFPFLDDVVPRLTTLQSLYCAHGTFSPALFSAMPGEIRTLRLQGSASMMFPVDALLDLIHCRPHHKIRLHKLVILRHNDPQTIGRLHGACAASGVEFIASQEYPLDQLNWIGRRT